MTTTQAPAPAAAPAERRSSTLARRLIVLLLLIICVILVMYSLGALTPRPKVAIVTASSGPYWDLIIKGAQSAAERHKVRLTVLQPKGGDEDEQTNAIKSLLGKHYDGVAISPNNPPRQAAVLGEIAAEADLITFDSDSNVSRRLCFIGTDNYDAGRMAGQQIRAAAPEGGEIILSIGSLEKENGQRRRQGVIDELLERSFERNRPMDEPVDQPINEPRSKYTIVTTLVDDLNPAKAQRLAADALAKHPNVKCFVGLFAYNTPAILKALNEAGKAGQVKVVGFDTYPETLDGIANGQVAATIMQDPFNIGYESVRVLADAARGERQALPLFQQFYLACEAVKADNLAQTRDDLARKMSCRGVGEAVHASATAPPTTQAAPTTQQATANE
jgi:ribose transport system substrate-binding protein